MMKCLNYLGGDVKVCAERLEIFQSNFTSKAHTFFLRVRPLLDVLTLTRVSMRCSTRLISSSPSVVNSCSRGSSSPR